MLQLAAVAAPPPHPRADCKLLSATAALPPHPLPLPACRLTGFVQPADPRRITDLMPPNAPAIRSYDGRSVEAPPFLEDLEVDLERKDGSDGGGGGGWFGGGGGKPGLADDPGALLSSLKRGDK